MTFRGGGATAVGRFQPRMVAIIKEEIDSWPVGETFDLYPTVRRLTLRVVADLLFTTDLTTDAVAVIDRATGVNPFDAARVADVGDVRFSRVFDNAAATADIEAFTRRIVEAGAMPLAAGGDHSITYPIFRALASPEAPIGMIHIDAHTDTWGPFRGEKFHHGAPFRLAAEDGLLDPTRTIQIGIRGAQNWGDGCRSAPDDPCMNFVVHLGRN